MKYSFLKSEMVGSREQIVVESDKLEIYLPKSFLEEGYMAEQAGEYIQTLGIFWFKTDNKWYELSLPLSFKFGYSDRTKFSGKIKPNMPSIDYDVFVLLKGDIFCYDTSHPQMVDDIELFIFKLVEGGKMPPTVGYDDALPLFISALEATGYTKLGVSSVTYELLLSELYRSKYKLNDPFRLHATKDNLYDYKMVRVTKIPELTSTYMGLAGEDNNQQIVSAVLNNREHRVEKISPVEKLLKL